MSLLRFLQTIDNSGIGKFIDKKLNVLKSTNPDRIYVENIRSFYNLPFNTAKLLCNMAVKENLFIKKFGVMCPDGDCERIILSVNSLDDLPERISCDTCELLEKEKFEYTKSELNIIEFYQLNREIDG